MSSEGSKENPSSTSPASPPPSDEVKTGQPQEEGSKEGPWKEDYDEVIEPSEEEKAQAVPAEVPHEKPKKHHHWVGIIVVIVIVALLIIWTLLSPKVMPPEGMTYVNSDAYSNLGNFTGSRDIWAGNVTWGFSVSGPENATAGTPIQVKVLVTKVSERAGNFFFRGLAITITNCSLWYANGTYVAKFSSVQDLGYGKIATIATALPSGAHDLYVSIKFTEYEVMRIGFVPLENVLVEKISLEQIDVS